MMPRGKAAKFIGKAHKRQYIQKKAKEVTIVDLSTAAAASATVFDGDADDESEEDEDLAKSLAMAASIKKMRVAELRQE